MHVRVDEARKYGRSLQIDHAGVRSLPLFHDQALTDHGDAIADDGDGVGVRVPAVHATRRLARRTAESVRLGPRQRVDPAVHEDEIGRRRRRFAAGNETDAERRPGR